MLDDEIEFIKCHIALIQVGDILHIYRYFDNERGSSHQIGCYSPARVIEIEDDTVFCRFENEPNTDIVLSKSKIYEYNHPDDGFKIMSGDLLYVKYVNLFYENLGRN